MPPPGSRAAVADIRHRVKLIRDNQLAVVRQPDAEIVLVGFEHLVAEGGRRARHRQLNVQRTVLEAAALALEAHRNALRVVRAVEIAAADLAELHVDQLAFVHHAFIRHVKDRGLDKHLRHRIGAETAVGRAEATVHLDDLPIVNLDAVNDLFAHPEGDAAFGAAFVVVYLHIGRRTAVIGILVGFVVKGTVT